MNTEPEPDEQETPDNEPDRYEDWAGAELVADYEARDEPHSA